jgi:hypothetical protein
LIHFKFFYPFLFLPSRGHTVPPFHSSERFHRSTIPPDRYLLLTGPTDFHVEQSSTITLGAIRSTMLPLAPCWFMYSITD